MISAFTELYIVSPKYKNQITGLYTRDTPPSNLKRNNNINISQETSLIIIIIRKI
jgi:hypothetical protein